MKKILFTIGLQFNEQNRTGVGDFYHNLLSAIDYDVWLVSNKRTFENKTNIHCIYMSNFRYKIFRYLRYILPITFFVKQHFDIYVSDGFIPITPKGSIQYAFVHDLMHVLYPENYKKSVLWNYNKFYHNVKKRNVRLISVSETTKQDLIHLKKINQSQIKIFPLTTYLQVKKSETEKFFLYIGAMRKNKNLLNIIKGFEKFIKLKNSDEYTLRIAGGKSYEYERLYEYVVSHKLSNVVQFLGYISDEEKIDLLGKCTALVMVSLYEGFGIPILEAGLNKIPIIASRIPAFEEFTKENLFFASPNNIDDIARAFAESCDKEKCINKANRLFEELQKYAPEQFKNNLQNLFNE